MEGMGYGRELELVGNGMAGLTHLCLGHTDLHGREGLM